MTVFKGVVSRLFTATKPQSPASECHQGQMGQASRAVGEGRGRPPTAAPCSCTGMKRVIFTQGQVGWMGRAPGGSPHGR